MNILQQLIQVIKNLLNKKGYKEFAFDLGLRESGNNYLIKNSLGYLGRWQFGMARLCDYGIVNKTSGYYRWNTGYSEQIFLNSPELQDKVFKWHVENLKKSIKYNLSTYLGKEVKGVYFDLSGAVAMAHLAGFGNVLKFVYQGTITTDDYGTSGIDYLQQFSGYNI